MTIKEVCVWLRYKEQTVAIMCREGKIPGIKIGGEWRFDRDELDKWIHNRNVTQCKGV
jgi:excisionase family DNA binding protein